MPKNWRLWQVSAARTSTSESKADVPGMMKQAFFASGIYWGAIANSGDIYPDDGGLGIWNEFKRLRETGKYDPSLPLAFAIARLFGESIETIFNPDA